VDPGLRPAWAKLVRLYLKKKKRNEKRKKEKKAAWYDSISL
jgi:hypothetical protein